MARRQSNSAFAVRKAALAVGVSLLALAIGAPAVAQVARDESVLRARDPAYKANGVVMGGFIMYPTLELGAEYDDNIYRTKNDKKDDILFTVRPGVSIQTDEWFPVNFNVSAYGEIGRHIQYSEEDYEAFGTAARMTYDLAEDWRFDVGGSVDRSLQERGLDVDSTASDPSIVWTYIASANLTYTGDPIAARFSPVYRRYDFLDAGSQNNDDQDRQEYLADFRFAYKLGANTSLFVDPSYIWVRYDDPVDDFGFNRDSQGYDVRVGLGYDASELIYVEAGIGYMRRNYRDNRLGSESGLSALARLYWNPTETLSIEGEFSRNISESDAVATGGSSKGAVQTGGTLRAGWLAADNVLLDAGVGFHHFNYNDTSRTDRFYLFDAGAKWFLNEYLYTGLRYAHERRDSTANSLDYRDNRVMLTIGGQL